MEAIIYKKLFIYLIPLNFLFGDYNAGFQIRYPDDWAIDVNVGYVDDIQGTTVANIYEDVFKSQKFYYHGPFIKTSFVSLYSRGFNPFRTDFNQIEASYKLLSYEDLDFFDPIDTGKVFNKSETMHAFGLSWMAGYNIVNGQTFQLDGFVGFGLQMRFSNILVNSYGENYQSDQFVLNERDRSEHLVPLFNAGFKIGLKMLEATPPE